MMSVRQSLVLSSGVVGFLLLAGNVIVWNRSASLESATEETSRIEHGMMAFKDARFHVVQIQQYLTDAAAVGEADFTEAGRNRDAALAKFGQLAKLMPESQTQIDELEGATRQLQEVGERMVHAYVDQGREAGNAIMKGANGFDSATEALTAKLEKMAVELHELEEKTETVQHASRTWMTRTSIGVAALALVIILAANFLLYRALMRMLGGEPAFAGEMARRIAAGDLTHSLRMEQGDSDSLLAHLDRMQTGLRDTVHTIRAGSDAVLEASKHLNREAEEVVRSSRAQSDAAASMSSSMEEMTASITQVAENSHNVSDHAGEAGQVAVQGGKEVHAVTEEIARVAESVKQASQVIGALGEESKRITAIVDTIREIAEQTNLLALNAAIEAARAGEQGRGFAVVADEVRKLAERTTQSTQEISGMVDAIGSQSTEAVRRMDQSLSEVGQGVAQAEKAHTAIASVSESSGKVVVEIREINSALQEQRSASTSIARNVEDIAQMAERNGHSVTKMAQDVRDLEQLSQNLEALMSRFKT